MIIESYNINNKLYVTKLFLCAYFNKSDKQIGRWKSIGLKSIEKKPKEINIRADIFDLDYVIKWVNENINQQKSSNSKSSSSENDDNFDLEDEEKIFDIFTKGSANQKKRLLLRLDQNRLDRLKKIEDIIEKEAKNKEYDSKYALIDKVKIGQQELARMFISFLKTSMPVLSKELEQKTQDEVYHALDRHFKKEVDKLLKYIITEEENTTTLDEVIQVIIEAVVDRNIEQKDIIKKIEDLK